MANVLPVLLRPFLNEETREGEGHWEVQGIRRLQDYMCEVRIPWLAAPEVGKPCREGVIVSLGLCHSLGTVQIAVLVIFLTIAAISIYGFSKLELGLEISELAPVTSYMRRFDEVYAEYFNKFDQPTDIFFLPTPPTANQGEHQQQQQVRSDVDLLNPDEFLGRGYAPGSDDKKPQHQQTPQWWKPEVQAALRLAHHRIASRPSTSRLVNPLLAMLDDPEIGPKLRQGDKQASSVHRLAIVHYRALRRTP